MCSCKNGYKLLIYGINGAPVPFSGPGPIHFRNFVGNFAQISMVVCSKQAVSPSPGR